MEIKLKQAQRIVLNVEDLVKLHVQDVKAQGVRNVQDVTEEDIQPS